MILTHNDLDGIVSAYFAMKVLKQKPSDITVYGYKEERDSEWKDILSNYKSDDPVCFTDLSFNRNELKWARGIEKTSKWIWLDHHYSSRNFDTVGIFDEVYQDVSEDVCAADLAYDWLAREGDDHVRDDVEWQEIAHDRDLWINDNRQLGMKLEMIIKDVIWKKQLHTFVKNMDKGIDWILDKYQDSWEKGMRKYKKSCQLANNTALIDEYKTFNVVVAYVDGSPSDVADTLYRTDNDIIAMVNMYTPNMILNLRGRRDDVDLSKIAEKRFIGGGGHKKAAGCKLRKSHLSGGLSYIAETIVEGLTEQWSKGV